MKFKVLPVLALLVISLFSSVKSISQPVFSDSTDVACSFTTNGILGFNDLSIDVPKRFRNSVSKAFFTYKYKGNMSWSWRNPYVNLVDEAGFGRAVSLLTQSSCGDFESVTFSVNDSIVNQWMKDGKIQFQALPVSGASISPTCIYKGSASRASYCVQVSVWFKYTEDTYTVSAKDLRTKNFDQGYSHYPLDQYDDMKFRADVKSEGDSGVTGLELTTKVLNTPYSSTTNIGALGRFRDTTDIKFTPPFSPPHTGPFRAICYPTINEVDSIYIDDTSSYKFYVSDTVIARDDNVLAGGLGHNSRTLQLGHRFHLTKFDSITSVSFYIDSSKSAPGSRVRFMLHHFDTVLNEPGATIDSTRIFTIPNLATGWYRLMIGCGYRFLAKGEYFISAEQLDPISMGLGYSTNKLTDFTANYANTAGKWKKAGSLTGLPSLADDVALMIRINLGHWKQKNVLGSDTTYFCNEGKAVLGKGLNYSSYQWNTGWPLDTLRTNIEGKYSVVVKDDFGCTFVGETYIKESKPFNLFPNSIGASTCGGSDGQASIVAFGGTPPFDYVWSNGGTGVSIQNVPGGTYHVTITDQIGCLAIQDIDVSGAEPDFNILGNRPSCNGYQNGSVEVDVIKGALPLTYNWSNGKSGRMLTNVSAGLYEVTVTDGTGCADVKKYTLKSPTFLAISGSSSIHPSKCGANDGRAIATVLGGVQPYKFKWGNGQNSHVIIGLFEGSYNVTITDSLGCQKSAQIDLMDPNPPSLTVTGSSVVCGGDSSGSASINVTGGTPPYNTLWSTGETSNSISNLISGTYIVQVTDDANCDVFGTALVDGPASIDFALAPNYDPTNGCNSEAILLNISGGTAPYSYNWDNGQSSPTARNLCDGTYSISVTDANGCLKTKSIILLNPFTVGIDELEENMSFSIYPNPAVDQLIINNPDLELKSIKVFDLNGKLLINISSGIYNQHTLDVSSLSQGSYILQAENKESKLATYNFNIVK